MPNLVKSRLFLINIFSYVIIFLFACSTAYTQNFAIEEVRFIQKDRASFDDAILGEAVEITKVNTFKPDMVGDDIGKLKRFYFDNGFFDVKIDTAVMYNYDEEYVIVKFYITENHHYRISKIVYTGLGNITETARKEVNKINMIKKRDFYNRVLIHQQANAIADALQNTGYMHAREKQDSGIVIERFDTTLIVTVNYTGSDTVYKFGRTNINIKKNVYGVSDDVVRKCIIYKEGDTYNKQNKLASERNIAKIAIIQSARIEVQSVNDNVVNFTANILLNDKHEVTPYVEGTNIDNYFFFGGGAKYLNKYFMGGGRLLVLELQALANSPKINRMELSATITQPNIFNVRTSLSDKISVGLYNLEGQRHYFIGNLTTFNYYIADFTFYNSVSIDLNEELRWINSVDSTGELSLFNSFLSTTIVHDNTNEAISPSKGIYHSITVGHAGLIPRLLVSAINDKIRYSQFVKLNTNNRFYFDISNIFRHTVFASAFRVGDIIEYGWNDRQITVQPIYRFFSGGSNSLRGWNAKQNGILKDKKFGGKFLVEGSLELRTKLFPMDKGFMKNLGGVLFLDYGNVWEDHKQFRFNQIALATGFGIRYDLFVGPIRVDLGFKLYDPSDPQNEKWLFENLSRMFKDKYAIHFGIGHAF